MPTGRTRTETGSPARCVCGQCIHCIHLRLGFNERAPSAILARRCPLGARTRHEITVTRSRPAPSARDVPISRPCRGTRQHRPRPMLLSVCCENIRNPFSGPTVSRRPASRTGTGTGARDIPRAPRDRPRRRRGAAARTESPFEPTVCSAYCRRSRPRPHSQFCLSVSAFPHRPADGRARVNSGAFPDATGPPPSRCPDGARAAERHGTGAAHASVPRCPPSSIPTSAKPDPLATRRVEARKRFFILPLLVLVLVLVLVVISVIRLSDQPSQGF